MAASPSPSPSPPGAPSPLHPPRGAAPAPDPAAQGQVLTASSASASPHTGRCWVSWPGSCSACTCGEGTETNGVTALHRMHPEGFLPVPSLPAGLQLTAVPGASSGLAAPPAPCWLHQLPASWLWCQQRFSHCCLGQSAGAHTLTEVQSFTRHLWDVVVPIWVVLSGRGTALPGS